MLVRRGAIFGRRGAEVNTSCNFRLGQVNGSGEVITSILLTRLLVVIQQNNRCRGATSLTLDTTLRVVGPVGRPRVQFIRVVRRRGVNAALVGRGLFNGVISVKHGGQRVISYQLVALTCRLTTLICGDPDKIIVQRVHRLGLVLRTVLVNVSRNYLVRVLLHPL